MNRTNSAVDPHSSSAPSSPHSPSLTAARTATTTTTPVSSSTIGAAKVRLNEIKPPNNKSHPSVASAKPVSANNPSSNLLAAVSRPPLSMVLPISSTSTVTIAPNKITSSTGNTSHHSHHSHGYHHHHHPHHHYPTDPAGPGSSAYSAAPSLSPQESQDNNNSPVIHATMTNTNLQQPRQLSYPYPPGLQLSSSATALNSTYQTYPKQHNDSVVSATESNPSTVASRSSSIITMSNPSSSSSSLNTSFKFQPQQKIFSFNIFNLHSKTITDEMVTTLLLNFTQEDKITDIHINKSDYEFCSATVTSTDYINILKLSNSLNGHLYDGVQLATSPISIGALPYFNDAPPHPSAPYSFMTDSPTYASSHLSVAATTAATATQQQPTSQGYEYTTEGTGEPVAQDNNNTSDNEVEESSTLIKEDAPTNEYPSVVGYEQQQQIAQYAVYPTMPYYIPYGQMYTGTPGVYPGAPPVVPGMVQGIMSPQLPISQLQSPYTQNAQYYNNYNNNANKTNNNNNNNNNNNYNRNIRSFSASFANLNINRDSDHSINFRSNQTNPASHSTIAKTESPDTSFLSSSSGPQYSSYESYPTRYTYTNAYQPQSQQHQQQEAMRYTMRGSQGQAYNNNNYYFKNQNQQNYYPSGGNNNKMTTRWNNNPNYYHHSRANSVRHYKNRYQMSELGNNYYSILHPEVDLDESKISPSSSYGHKESGRIDTSSSTNPTGSNYTSGHTTDIDVPELLEENDDDDDDDLVFSPLKHVAPTKLFVGNIPFTSTFENLYYFLATSEMKKGLEDISKPEPEESRSDTGESDDNSISDVDDNPDGEDDDDEEENETIIAEVAPLKERTSDSSSSDYKFNRTLSLNLQRQPDGTSRGYATIDAESEEQAQLLILNFNGAFFEGRDLTVRYDRLPKVIARHHYSQNYSHTLQSYNNNNKISNNNRRYGYDGVPF